MIVKNSVKRFLSIMLSLMMAMSGMGLPALAESGLLETEETAQKQTLLVSSQGEETPPAEDQQGEENQPAEGQ